MSVHPILDARPEWQQYEAERVALTERRRAVVEQVVAAQAKADEARSKHQRAVQEAVERPMPVPPAPAVPDLSHLDQALALLTRADYEHRDRRVPVLADIAGAGGVDACRERVRVVTTNALDLVRQLNAARRDVVDTLRLLAQLYDAEDARDGVAVRPPRSTRVRAAITLDDFAFAAENDVPLDELAPSDEPDIQLVGPFEQVESRAAAIAAQRNHDRRLAGNLRSRM